jgi:hypothetical protein
MPDTPTPGHICYAAYVTAVERQPVAARITDAMWARLLPAEQRAWEAAAQAVLAPRLTDQAAKMHLLLAYLLDHATPADRDTLHGWLTDVTAHLHAERQAAAPDAAALAARVWARQAPSSRWQVVPPEETP